MITISGYQTNEQLYKSAHSIIYRGRREADDQPVILKTLNPEYLAAERIAHLRREYDMTRRLKAEGVIKAYGLEKYKNGVAIILEDFGGHSLALLLQERKLTLPDFLHLATRITASLAAIHQQQIMHKDINPANIVVLPPNSSGAEWLVKIIDFGISTALSRETPQMRNPNMLEGTPAYVSPEQTGRMNRTVDYRTDFYSLGVTLYEMLIGQPPFQASDPMALVHAHIAKQPLPPIALRQDVPPMISNIIMKLLAKTAEERYQSASGLKVDLEHCLTQWQSTGQIESFELGQQDISDRFELPQKLYGREQEITALLTVSARVGSPPSQRGREESRGSETALVTGPAGIGKSALINEAHRVITGIEQRGYFISGKFDQYRRNTPYASLIQAFQDLVRQILTESDARIAAWREKLLAALHPNGQIIIDVIPEVELIIGPQPEAPSLPPTETQNRFTLVFQNFVNVFAGTGQPLVIFLDALQWADTASLKLIQLLVTNSDSHHLFMIGAYRDNEVSPDHPLSLTLNEINEAGVPLNHITLKPLELVHINQLIVDTLHCSADRAKALAELVLSKTAGNPFFVNQFLRSLHDEKLLTFIPPSFPPSGGDEREGGWQWDVNQIQAQDITDNVVELMAGKIQKLAPAAQHVLTLAACIGNEFDLQILSVVHEKSPVATAGELWEALQEGLILTISDFGFPILDWEEESPIPEGYDLSNLQYRFLHDRVQHAAYSLIADDHKKKAHLKIGQSRLKNTPEDGLEEKIMSYAVGQKNSKMGE